jgi:uncharacterized protein (TIGR00369 family)
MTDTIAAIDAAPALGDLHKGCFACGVCNTGGLHLHFDSRENGEAHAEWMPGEAFRSYPDRVHGGVIATLVDSALVHALYAKGIIGVTAELTIRYLRSVRLDRPVEVRGREESCRHGIHLCSAEVIQDGILMVKASAKFMSMPEIPS